MSANPALIQTVMIVNLTRQFVLIVSLILESTKQHGGVSLALIISVLIAELI